MVKFIHIKFYTFLSQLNWCIFTKMTWCILESTRVDQRTSWEVKSFHGGTTSLVKQNETESITTAKDVTFHVFSQN